MLQGCHRTRCLERRVEVSQRKRGWNWKQKPGRKLFPAVIFCRQRTVYDRARHLEQVCGRCGMEVVYVADAISSYDRKRLIEHKVPFVVPGNQMYLPFMAIKIGRASC